MHGKDEAIYTSSDVRQCVQSHNTMPWIGRPIVHMLEWHCPSRFRVWVSRLSDSELTSVYSTCHQFKSITSVSNYDLCTSEYLHEF